MSRIPMKRVVLSLAVAGASLAAFAAPASAASHRDAVFGACANQGGSVQACSCLADRYEAELGDKGLAFYARTLGRSGDRQAVTQVMRELGLTPAEVGAIVRQQAAVDRSARADCGLAASR